MKLIVSTLVALRLLSGCTALAEDHNRKITAWGVWCTMAACGAGYLHTERGPDVKSEESAKPSLPGPLLKELK